MSDLPCDVEPQSVPGAGAARATVPETIRIQKRLIRNSLKDPDGYADGFCYVLRTCSADMTSRRGFVWPESGPVTCPDWSHVPECGNGLHGLLWGHGNGVLLDWQPDAKWLVVRVPASSIIDLGGKVKFPEGEVVFCGDRFGATSDIIARGADQATVVGATLAGGNYATLAGGYGATLTGGNGATLTGGYGATLTGGNYATLTGGNYATLTGGYRATLTGGNGATLTGGNYATLTGGNGATLTGGNGATLAGGYGATLTGGDGATLVVRWWDPQSERYRLAVGCVGDGGIKPNVAYRVHDGKFVEVTP